MEQCQGTGEAGFSLIEVIVACTIIGVLAALAIPVFATYKADGFNVKANNDLKNAIVAEEANFDVADAYVACGPNDCGTILPGFSPSGDVLVAVTVVDNAFAVATCSGKGDKDYLWDSQTGDFVVVDNGGDCNPVPPPLS